VNLILAALGKAGMRMNSSKYTFHAKEMKFLGYIIGLKRIKIDLKYRPSGTDQFHKI
jgi:hypothetical protein